MVRMGNISNKNLCNAKALKNDEFYTLLSEIQAELKHYKDKFAGKTVFCNCDDPFESNFVKYFLMNFNRLGLKELIAMGYRISPVWGSEIVDPGTPYVLRVSGTKEYLHETQTDFDMDGVKRFLKSEKASVMSLAKGNWAKADCRNIIQFSAKDEYIDQKTGRTQKKTVKHDLYYKAGDFRSDESIALLQQADIVVTNPPFSLFREYVAQLVKYGKRFLILGNVNAITYKEIFPMLKENRMWIGYSVSNGDRPFNVPDDYPLKAAICGVDKNGRKFIRVKGIRWFTNLDHAKRHQMQPLELCFTYRGHEDMYPMYDNYNAINVNKVSHIPCDYMGVMGVPITFLDKHCPEQFKIVGGTNYSTDIDGRVWKAKVNSKELFKRLLIQRNYRATTG